MRRRNQIFPEHGSNDFAGIRYVWRGVAAGLFAMVVL